MPKVPHEVPVAKAIRHATIKMIAGKKEVKLPAFCIMLLTNASLSKRLVVFFSALAKVKIRMAGTIAIKP